MKDYDKIIERYYEERDFIDIQIYDLRQKRKVLSWRIRQYEFKQRKIWNQ